MHRYYKRDGWRGQKLFSNYEKIDPRVSGQFVDFDLKVTTNDGGKYNFEFTLQGVTVGPEEVILANFT